MRLNKTLKRIVALGTGLTTLGATFLGAMAQADLADYPAPFVNNGVFDGFIVLGDNAAAKDVIGAVEISTAMQAASVTTTTVAAAGARGTVSLSGSNFKVEENSDNLNLYENLSEVVNVLDDSDWDLLADGEINNEKGTFDYEQLIYLPNAHVLFDEDTDRDDEDPHLYLYFPEAAGDTETVFRDGRELLVYRISFPSALQTDVDSSDDLDDLEDETLNILGKEFTFVTTDNSSATFILLGGSLETTMAEGEEKTFTVGVGEDAKTFTVKVNAIEDGSTSSENRVFFTVNGQSIDGMKEGETETVNDARDQIAIKEVINVDGQETSAISDQVTFFIGAKKLELDDSSSKYATASANAGSVEFNGESLNDLIFDVKGTIVGDETHITTFDFAAKNTEDYHVGIGETLRERIIEEGDEEDVGMLIFDTLDIRFEGLDTNMWETIRVEDRSDTRYEVDVKNSAGHATDIPYAFLNSSQGGSERIVPGKEESKRLVLDYDAGLGLNASKDTFFMVTDDDTSRNSHLLSIGSVDTTNKEITIQAEGSGQEDLDVTYDSTTFLADFVLNGQTYQVFVQEGDKTANLTSLTYTSGVAANQNAFYSEYGAKLIFYDNSSLLNASAQATMQLAENPKDSRDDSGTKFNLYVQNTVRTSAAAEIGSLSVSSDDPEWSGEKTLDTQDDKRQSYTSYGTMTERDTSADQHTVEFTYGEDEAVANVFLTVGDTVAVTSSGSEEGTVTSTTVNQISVGASKLASEVPDITAVNAIVVGGPCANAAAAQLTGVGNSVPECLSGLTLETGEAILKLYEDAVTGKVALLVAGASADDTRRAARVLSDYENYALTGTEVAVSGTSMTDITVGPVTSSSSSGDAMEDGESMEESEESEETA